MKITLIINLWCLDVNFFNCSEILLPSCEAEPGEPTSYEMKPLLRKYHVSLITIEIASLKFKALGSR